MALNWSTVRIVVINSRAAVMASSGAGAGDCAGAGAAASRNTVKPATSVRENLRMNLSSMANVSAHYTHKI
jgi:hypothetical protein